MKEKQKTVSEIIDDVKSEICDRYCKHFDREADELEYEVMLHEYCEECPLNRLRGTRKMTEEQKDKVLNTFLGNRSNVVSCNRELKITKTSTAHIPTRGSADAAGLDLYADTSEPVKIWPGDVYPFDTGICMEIPAGMFGAIYPRSGIATKRGLRLPNCVGVIDSDYRGHIIVPLRNDSNEVQTVDPHERIAQIIFQRYEFLEPVIVSRLSETERGAGGFGSSGRGDEHGFV